MGAVHGTSGDSSTLPLGERIANLPAKAKEVFNSLKRKVTSEPKDSASVNDITFKTMTAGATSDASPRERPISAKKELQSDITTRFKDGLQVAYNETIGKINFSTKPDTAKLEGKGKDLADNYKAKIEKAYAAVIKLNHLGGGGPVTPQAYKAAIKEAKSALADLHSSRSKLANFYRDNGKNLQSREGIEYITDLLSDNVGTIAQTKSNLSQGINRITIEAAKSKLSTAIQNCGPSYSNLISANKNPNPVPDQVKQHRAIVNEVQQHLKEIKKALSELKKVDKEATPQEALINQLSEAIDKGNEVLKRPELEQHLNDLFPHQ